MANIKKKEGKNGVSYKITVSCGRDSSGKQLRRYQTFWPAPGMTPRQAEKAAQKAAFEFERSIEQGYMLDNRQTFADYAEYVLTIKEREGRKLRTLDRYRELLQRINPAIGHMKLADIRPQHLNSFYANLAEPGISQKEQTATAKPALQKAMEGHSRAEISRLSGISPATMTAATARRSISAKSAAAIAAALKERPDKLFSFQAADQKLSAKTILEHHRLIRTILNQAEKEMLIPYNPAAKATPPKATQEEVSYFQPEQVAAIMEALESEPLKWRTITYLLIYTGCRRGEVMGLKWEKVNLSSGEIVIDSALLYSPKRGIFESTTKTGNRRTISIPATVCQLLKQYRSEYTRLKLANGDRWQNSGYVFVKDDGSPMNPDNITAWLSDFAKRHGLPHIHPHAFRHTMASVLISQNMDIVTVSKRLGHAKVSTTSDIYAHVLEEADKRAGDCLEAAFLRTGTK